MKINNKIIAISLLSIATIAAIVIAIFPLGQTPSTSSNNSGSDNSQIPNTESIGTDDKVIAPSTNNSASQDQSIPPEKPAITRAEQSGDYIRISAIFTKISTGTCALTLEKVGSSTISKSASIIVGPSYYTCNGFKVSRTELPSSGEWTAKITHQLDSKTTVSDTKTIIVQ